MQSISTPVVAASPWNSLEVTRLVIAAATPLLVAILGFFITRRLKSLENYQWGQQRVVEKRLQVFDQIAPLLNRLLCYFTFVGTWKEYSPPDVLRMKRTLDELVHANAPLFSADFVVKYGQFMDLCFHTYVATAEEPKLITASTWRRKAAGAAWKQEWDAYFEAPSESDQAAVRVRERYAELTAYLAEQLGVGLVDVKISTGKVPFNIT